MSNLPCVLIGEFASTNVSEWILFFSADLCYNVTGDENG